MRERVAPAELLWTTVQRQPHPPLERPLDPSQAMEPPRLRCARVIRQRDLESALAPLYRSRRCHLSDHRHAAFGLVDARDGGDPRAVEIAPRVILKQVANRRDTLLGHDVGPPRPDAR